MRVRIIFKVIFLYVVLAFLSCSNRKANVRYGTREQVVTIIGSPDVGSELLADDVQSGSVTIIGEPDLDVDEIKEVPNNNNDFLPAPRADLPSQILHRKGYTVSYNKDTMQPNWAAWHLTAEHTDGEWARPSGNAFHEDTEVPAPRASNYDYKGSGWTRGHMCPAGDNRWDADAMYESFLLSNICPQHTELNSGDWNDIEQECRRWAGKYGDIYIVCGPIFYRQTHEEIGYHKIPVPEAFFKVVLCLNSAPKGIGFICKNTDGNRKTDFYVNTIAQVERITGYIFFPQLSENIASSVKGTASLEMW